MVAPGHALCGRSTAQESKSGIGMVSSSGLPSTGLMQSNAAAAEPRGGEAAVREVGACAFGSGGLGDARNVASHNSPSSPLLLLSSYQPPTSNLIKGDERAVASRGPLLASEWARSRRASAGLGRCGKRYHIANNTDQFYLRMLR